MSINFGALAADRSDTAPSGFYGGISFADRVNDGPVTSFGPAPTLGLRFHRSSLEDIAPRALVFGGYRWRSDVAVEAAISSIDKYALEPAELSAGGRGLGLKLLPGGRGIGDAAGKVWSVDLTTSWSFYRSFALYGRMGYAQAESLPMAYGPATTFAVQDSRRVRDGVNFGLGLRYDMSSRLGLKLEYGRFARFAGEAGWMPDSDQVSVGLQLRF